MLNELSLFSGYGGFSLGLRLAGLQTRTVAYVEWEKYPQEILKARIKDGYLSDAPIFADISSFRGEQFRGLVDIITAGFPCQPHSVAGLQRGANDDRNKWPDTLRVIREVGPRIVVLENVPGLASASKKRGTPAYGGTVVGELASLGYSVHWQTLGASDVGAPHRRKRWWCIGVADSERERESSGIWSSKGVSGSRTQTTNPSVRQGRDSSIEGSVNIRHNAYNGGGSTTELVNSEGEWSGKIRDKGGKEGASDSDVLSGISGRLHSGQLADSNNEGLEGIGANGHQAGWQEPDVSLGLFGGAIPVWPPSPNDTAGWEWVIRERPDLAPALENAELLRYRGWHDGNQTGNDGSLQTGGSSGEPPKVTPNIRGVANGRSNRVDELKALGNGIVPAVLAEFLQRVAGHSIQAIRKEATWHTIGT